MSFDGQRVCSVPDNFGGGDCQWPFDEVTVFAEGKLGSVNLINAVEPAIKAWNEVCGIRLSYSSNSRTAHIRIGRGRIDGPSGTLAWSELPCGFTRQQWRSLEQKYDTSEIWTVSENPPEGKIDAVRVIAHELGHAIGISHISDGNLMAPRYSAQIRLPQRGDIAEARSRYGLATPLPPTEDPQPDPVTPACPQCVCDNFDWQDIVADIIISLMNRCRSQLSARDACEIAKIIADILGRFNSNEKTQVRDWIALLLNKCPPEERHRIYEALKL